MEWLTACRPARWRAALSFETERLGGFEVDDQLVFGRLPDRALGVTMLPLSRPSKAYLDQIACMHLIAAEHPSQLRYGQSVEQESELAGG
jgi:hypothetical protein